VRLGSCTNESWLSLATPKIHERILRYEQDEIRFTLLAIAKKPLTILQDHLSTNAKLLGFIDQRLESLDANWRATTITEDSSNLEVRAYTSDVDEVMVAEVGAESDVTTLLGRRGKLVDEQDAIKFKIRDEQEKLEIYTTYATRKRHDYSPFIRKMLGFLADKQSLQQYLE